MSQMQIRATGTPEVVTTGDGRLSVSVPIKIKRRGGRKIIMHQPTPFDEAPTSLQLALARGHRWLAMLASGQVQSLKEIAKREGVCSSYVNRMVNLTTLAPDIVAAILDDALPDHIRLLDLAVGVTSSWEDQRQRVAKLVAKSRGTSTHELVRVDLTTAPAE